MSRPRQSGPFFLARPREEIERPLRRFPMDEGIDDKGHEDSFRHLRLKQQRAASSIADEGARRLLTIRPVSMAS